MGVVAAGLQGCAHEQFLRIPADDLVNNHGSGALFTTAAAHFARYRLVVGVFVCGLSAGLT
jgi:hypothetical protein